MLIFSCYSLCKHARSNLNDVLLKEAVPQIQEAMQAMTITNKHLPTTSLVSHIHRIITHILGIYYAGFS